MRRILQSQGCEVIHLGHNRSVQEVVDAALEEDVQGVAVSSYQGGHVEYFEYLVESLRAARRRPRQGRRRRRRRHRARRDRAAARVRRDDLLPRGRPADGPGRDDQLGRRGLRPRPVGSGRGPTPTPCSPATGSPSPARSPAPRPVSSPTRCSARVRERGRRATRPRCSASPAPAAPASPASPTSWSAGFRVDQQDKLRIAVIAVDPTRRKGGGALLGDRIRMNSLDGDRIFFRSLATRGAHELPEHLADVIAVLKAAGFDLVDRRDARHRPGRRRRSCRSSTPRCTS